MRRAFVIITVIVGIAAIQMWRVAAASPSNESAMLFIAIFALLGGMLAASLLISVGGRMRDLLPARVVRVWWNGLRSWTDAKERANRP